jgi:hypothetical protein
MEQAKRDALLANPGAYLEYAKYIKAGNDPSTFRYNQQPISMMTQAQRDALTNSQRAELSGMLAPVAPVDNSGG